MEREVTGKCVNCGGGYGLAIPARFPFYGPEKSTKWFETGLKAIAEQLKKCLNYCLK